MVKFTSLMGLGTFLVVETKEAAVLFGQIRRKYFGGGHHSLQWKRPALVKYVAPTAGFSFCFLRALTQAGVLEGKFRA